MWSGSSDALFKILDPISLEQVKTDIPRLVRRWTVASKSQWNTSCPLTESGQGHVTLLFNFATTVSLEWITLDTTVFVCRWITASTNRRKINWALRGCGWGHVTTAGSKVNDAKGRKCFFGRNSIANSPTYYKKRLKCYSQLSYLFIALLHLGQGQTWSRSRTWKQRGGFGVQPPHSHRSRFFSQP